MVTIGGYNYIKAVRRSPQVRSQLDTGNEERETLLSKDFSPYFERINVGSPTKVGAEPQRELHRKTAQCEFVRLLGFVVAAL